MRLTHQFAQLFLSSLLTFFHKKKTKHARLKNPTDHLHKNLMKPLRGVALYGNFYKLYKTGWVYIYIPYKFISFINSASNQENLINFKQKAFLSLFNSLFFTK